jgi:MFS family permease
MAIDATDPAAKGAMPLWRNRDYLLFWGGRTVSALGTSMSGMAFPLLILAMTHSPALAGLAGSLRTLPYVLLSLPAGVLVDRCDRKRVMLLCDSVRAFTLGSVPFAWWLGHLIPAQLYVATTIEGTMLLFYNAANQAALPRLVPQARLAAAAAQDEGAYYAASLAGPAVGGALYQIGRGLPPDPISSAS